MKTLYHGSPESNLIAVGDFGLFDGLFFSSREESALSHGEILYSVSLDDEEIANDHDLERATDEQFRNMFKWLSDDEYSKYENILRDLIIYEAESISAEAMVALREEVLYEASWFVQKLRGWLAAKLGFKAVEMSDEHGTSYLVLPGVILTSED